MSHHTTTRYAGYAPVPRSGGVVRRAGSATVLDTRFRFVQFSQRNAVVAEADPGDHAVHQPGYGRTDRRTDVVLSDLASSGACARHGCCLRRCVALMLLFVFM